MAQDIESFSISCGASKEANSKPRGLLHSLPVPDRPWQSIGIGFLGQLPQSNNFNYLLPIGCNRPINVTSSSCADHDYSHSQRCSVEHSKRSRKTSWDSRIHCVRQRHMIHFHILEGTAKTHGNKTSHVYCIPSSNGRCHRMS